MATLSFCIIVKDEERFLGDCLDNIKDIVDEIIVVDTGSSDKTKEMATGAGAKVFDFKWGDDFSSARNFSLEKATSNWILILDADERLDDKGKAEIRKLINIKDHALKNIIGFKLDQRTYYPKEDVDVGVTTNLDEITSSFTGHESSMLVRLFKNNSKIRFKNKVHELVEHSIRDNDGEIVETDIIVHHFSHIKKETLLGKTQNYVDLMWNQLEKDPKNPRYNRQVGLAFLEKGRKDLALKYFKRTVAIDPKFPGILADLGKLYVEMNDIRLAIKMFNMAIAVDKNDVSSMNNLAVIYMNLGKFDVAKKLLDKALQKDPGNKAVFTNHEKAKKKIS